MYPPLQSRKCNRPSVPSKGLKVLDAKLPKLPFFRKNTPKRYFGVETGDFNLFVRLIPKCDSQRQSFTKTVTNC